MHINSSVRVQQKNFKLKLYLGREIYKQNFEIVIIIFCFCTVDYHEIFLS